MWGLTCRDLLGVYVGFDVRWEVGGFCVLARGQVWGYWRPGCHGGRGIPSHGRAGISGHHSTPTWLRDEDENECLELQCFSLKAIVKLLELSPIMGLRRVHLWLTPLTAACVKALYPPAPPDGRLPWPLNGSDWRTDMKHETQRMIALSGP